MQREVSTLPNLAFATNSLVGNLGAPFRVSDEDGEDDHLQELGDNEPDVGQGALMVEDA